MHPTSLNYQNHSFLLVRSTQTHMYIYIYIYFLTFSHQLHFPLFLSLLLFLSFRAMQEACDLRVHINGHSTFLLNQDIVSKYSGRLRKMIEQERKQIQATLELSFQINGFPGGPLGFELAARFCYNNGEVIPMISPSNLPLLHSSAIFLEMDEDAAECNLLHQADSFLDGLFYWTWSDVLASLKACGPLFSSVQSSGLLDKLLSSLLVMIAAANSDAAHNNNIGASSSSASSSPDVVRFASSTKTPDSVKRGPGKAWWFDDLTTLSPSIIETMFKVMGVYGSENNSLVLTRFLLHYLKAAAQRPSSCHIARNSEYGGLADTAVNGVVLMGRTDFTCRGLLWVLRVVSNLGLGKDCKGQLERLIGGMLDQATLDDLLVSGHDGGGVYDVNLVLRLLRVFATGEDGMCLQRTKKVGRLMDKYMGEISPDPSLKVSKFLAVAESLPDAARDCFDGVYRAIEIYLESHPTLSFEERSRLCRCLNYEKLTLECSKDLAKNPRIPPRIAVQALAAQQSKIQPASSPESPSSWETRSGQGVELERSMEEKEEMRVNLERMQFRVMELEKVCRQMKGQMSRIVKSKVASSPIHHRNLPKLC